MNEMIVKVGLVILGIFIAVALVIGTGKTSSTNLNTKANNDINKLTTDTTNP